LAWQEAYATLWGASIGWHHRGLLLASVWLGYAADRWLDGWRSGRQKSRRHDFYHEHRWGLLGIWSGVLPGAIAVAAIHLQAAELWRGGWLVVGVLAYTGFAQTQSRKPHYKTIKAVGIAVLIQASACLFPTPWALIRVAHLAALIGPIPLFALNCLMIENWEKHELSREDPPSSHVRLIALSVAAMGLALLNLLPTAQTATELIALPSIVSLILLWTLHSNRSRIAMAPCRTLADFCLLTPFIALLTT
jgi:hypothetical protein